MKFTRTIGAGAIALAFALGSTAATQAAPSQSAEMSQSARAQHEGKATAGSPSTQDATNAVGPRLNGGQDLTPDEFMNSASEQFTVSADGSYGATIGLVWAPMSSFPEVLSGTGVNEGPATSVLAMQTDGNLVLYVNGNPVWFTSTYNNPGAYTVLQDDGNLVVYSAAGKALWASMTFPHSVDAFVDDDARGEGLLAPQWYVTSQDGRYTFVMQSDGNAVVYFGNRALWSTGTNKNPGAALRLLANGTSIVTTGEGQRLWSSRAGGTGDADYRMVMQNDGNLVIYQYRQSENYSKARVMWQSGTGGRR